VISERDTRKGGNDPVAGGQRRVPPKQTCQRALDATGIADPGADVREIRPRDRLGFGAAVPGVGRQIEQISDRREREAEIAGAANETQPVECGGAVLPVSAGSSLRGFEQTAAFVVPNGFDLDAGIGRQRADPHHQIPTGHGLLPFWSHDRLNL
jgi:hypothetical protein